MENKGRTQKVRRPYYSIEYGGVAQLGEHLLCKQGVIGSIPFISTSRLNRQINRAQNFLKEKSLVPAKLCQMRVLHRK